MTTLRKNRFLFMLIALVLIISTVAAVGGYSYFLNSHKKNAVCDSLLPSSSTYFESGLTPVCGINDASDGRLMITLNNYHFAQAKDIQFHFSTNEQPPLPNEVFLLLNVTVDNLGGGNTSIGGGWQVALQNGTSLLPESSNFIANATFPDTLPNQTIPDRRGGLYLPPGSNVSLWIFIYIPLGNPVSSDINRTSDLSLQFLMYKELSYGGTYEGDGAFGCLKVACTKPNVQFIIEV